MGRLEGLSPRRRLVVFPVLAVAVALLIATLAAMAISLVGRGPAGAPDAGRPGPVVLVPGYGGGTGGVDALAERIRAAGRVALVVALPDGGTGDLGRQADAVEDTVRDALANGGAASVDLIGHSAGGVVVRRWVADYDGSRRARRVVTLGSPHHGATIAGVGAAAVPGFCPTACQQLAPGSQFLRSLASPVPTPPAWLSVWTAQDQTVVPPESARLDGATNVEIQSVCPDIRVDHSGLLTHPLVTALVLRAIGPGPLRPPTAADCGGA